MSSAWEVPVAAANCRGASASSSFRYTVVLRMPYVWYHPPLVAGPLPVRPFAVPQRQVVASAGLAVVVTLLALTVGLPASYGLVRSTLVISQLPVEAWHPALAAGDPTLADAILDRLVHNAHRLAFKGSSMRRRQPLWGGITSAGKRTAGDGWHHTDGRLDTRAGRPSSQALPVSRQDHESPTLERRHGSKGTFVEAEQPARPESLSEHDQ